MMDMYALLMGGSGGGSGLPSVTSADLGKTLDVQKIPHESTTVIAPEQNCTEYDEEMGVIIPNFDAALFTDGTGVFWTVNSETFYGVVGDGGVGVFNTEQFSNIHIYYDPETQKAYVGGETLDSEFITSATVKVVVADYSYGWEKSDPPYDAVITLIGDAYVISGDYNSVITKIDITHEPVKILVASDYLESSVWWNKIQLTDFSYDAINHRIRLRISDGNIWDWNSDGTVTYED